MNGDYLEGLNEQQRAAVEYCDGPQLVIAGAGSGKTRVLTHKILHLLNMGLEPWRILALTFTNKAAREMRQRIAQLAGNERASKLWMGTFHSIFAKILRLHAPLIGYKPGYTIYDTTDSRSAIKMIIKDLGLDTEVYKPANIAASISWAKNLLMSCDDYANDRELMRRDLKNGREKTAEIFRIYRDRCVASGAMDFDDLLYYMWLLLRDNPEVLDHYREYFQYLLVDEYQDTNYAQHVIVTMLTQPRGALTVVGDDAQSIYSFRGANIRNIIELSNTYPTLRVFKLEQNYRSTQNIINAAGSLISHNREGIPKNVFSKNQLGSPVIIEQVMTDREEATTVAQRLAREKMYNHDSYEDFAILYRTNAQSRGLEEALRQRNIPYRIYGGISFYQRKEVKDAVAYFRLALNPDDDEALKRVINFPARGIGDTTLGRLVRGAIDAKKSILGLWAETEPSALGLNKGSARKVDDFAQMIYSFAMLVEQGEDAFQIAKKIIDTTGMVQLYKTERTPENIAKIENLEELLSAVRQYVDERLEQGAPAPLSDFIAEISLATDQDSEQEEESNERVTLMTAHAAKGLEYNNIFVVGVEEDLFPSSMAQDTPSQIEEERRLLYVAITRAKNFCMLTHAKSRFRNGQFQFTRPSRFLQDIDPKFVKRSDISHYQPQERNNPMAHFQLPFQSFSPKPVSPKDPISQPTSKLPTHQSSELSIGTRISHDKFGPGTILEINTTLRDHRIVVEFDNQGTKTLLLKYAKFEIL